ncbi:MAG: ABC transporter permease [Anaerolineae bacterium]|nr:ABC transporter permease [Anaerolineae bacterium]
MRKLWLVAQHEYLKQVKKKSFLLTVFGIPLLLIAIFTIVIFVLILDLDKRPLGYVDRAGVILQPELPPPNDATIVDLHAYPDEEHAQAALAAQEIQAYYLLPADYLSSQQVALYYWDEKPDSMVTDEFADFLRANLIAAQPDAVRDRLAEGIKLSVHSADGQRESSNDNPLAAAAPYFTGLLLFFSISITGGYLLQAVVDEKENRTMEILITSLSPGELIGGKTVGLTCVALTQLFAWGLPVLIGIPVAMHFIPRYADSPATISRRRRPGRSRLRRTPAHPVAPGLAHQRLSAHSRARQPRHHPTR